ncbi:hypothetical protein EMIHUDRAFT_71205, partial [Emiliania huxleyi CCMP1516]|uniref:PPIase cyclophilin-type domain-containing protein n=2 Tax=Emiliania huxleyi TaxID=2903 RepID=A0A0D3KH81_EMIH1
RFEDEDLTLKHTGPGLLSMARDMRRCCQFFVTCDACDWLDGKHVPRGAISADFTQVLDGLLTVRKIENRRTLPHLALVAAGANSKPKLPIVIAQCGEM